MARKSSRKTADQILGVLDVEEAQQFLMDSLNLPWTVTYPDHRSAFNRWLKNWQGWFTYMKEVEQASDPGEPTLEEFLQNEDVTARDIKSVQIDAGWQTLDIPRERVEWFAPILRTALRNIWYERDPRQRDWYFYRLRDDYHRMIVRAENPHLLDITAPDVVERLLQLEEASKKRGDDAIQRARLFERVAGTDLFEDVPRICQFEAALYWLQVNQKLMVYCEGPTCPAPYFFRTEKGQKYCSPECANPARREAKLRWWNENRKKREGNAPGIR